MMNKVAKFNIGDLVIHKRIRYRAIVVDIDPLFQASGNYNARIPKYEFATQHPWYRLLVDDSSQITYVEEPMLIADPEQHPINNPLIREYFNENGDGGSYNNVNAKH